MLEPGKYLESLHDMLVHEREQLKERICTGHKEERSRDMMIGQCEGLKSCIDKVHKQIRSINGDTDDTPDGQLPTHDPRRARRPPGYA